MTPIRPHKKSRTGCRTCRKRRVKCDETHPVCKNCLRRELECSYDPRPKTSNKIEISSLLSSTPPQDAPPTPSSSTSMVAPSRSFLPLPPAAPPPPRLDMMNLELLHHYTTSTYSTFSTSASAHEVWRMNVPRLAFRREYDFLMHAVLAISALHLSSLCGGEQYSIVAASHYQSASVSLRTALPNRANLDGNALFVTSSFICIYVFASPQATQRDAPNALTWIPLLRGMHKILKECWDAVKDGELAPLLRVKASFRLVAPIAPNPLLQLPDYLSILHLPTEDVPDPEEVGDPVVANVYKEAVEKLRESWQIVSVVESRCSSAFMWPITAPEQFFVFLMERRPRALVLLAHYCVMFKMMENFWWIKGRAMDEVGIILEMVDERWKRWLEWPLRFQPAQYVSP